jgi:hypothetical protein
MKEDLDVLVEQLDDLVEPALLVNSKGAKKALEMKSISPRRIWHQHCAY